MIQLLRIQAILLGLALMVGESIRSWGQGRNPIVIMDDFLLGIPLILTAWLMARPSAFRHCLFTASYAACVGLLYGSLASKLLSENDATFASNINGNLLTLLVAVGFATSIAGLAGCLWCARSLDGGRNQYDT